MPFKGLPSSNQVAWFISVLQHIRMGSPLLFPLITSHSLVQRTLLLIASTTKAGRIYANPVFGLLEVTPVTIILTHQV